MGCGAGVSEAPPTQKPSPPRPTPLDTTATASFDTEPLGTPPSARQSQCASSALSPDSHTLRNRNADSADAEASLPCLPGVPAHAAEEEEGTENGPPESLEDWTHVLLDRFEVRRSAFAGRGGFAVVRRGRDLQEQRTVAVKFYAESNFAEAEAEQETLKKFRHEVEVLQKLHGCYSRGLNGTMSPKSLSPSGGALLSEEVEVFFRNMPETSQDLFVALLGHSKDVSGRPGVDAATRFCFLVEELGLQTLEQHVQDAHEFAKPLPRSEVREIFFALVRVVMGLHACGLAHLDIKPSNIMLFRCSQRGRCWKLVDMDGALQAGEETDPRGLAVTPVYCPPELAGALASDAEAFQVSRKLDVWSSGMSILDCVLPRPLLQARYAEDPESYWSWLATGHQSRR